MSEQRTEALLATIDAQLADLARIKAERDELRDCLLRIARINSHEDYTYDQREAIIAEEARAVLERTQTK